MPPQLALLLAAVFMVWLLRRERKSREALSGVLWLPITWAFIIGSRPLSEWLQGSEPGLETAPINYLEGSPLDRTVYFLLIVAGLLVLFGRRERLAGIVWQNKWLFLFYLYLFLSITWSDYSYVSFKRLIKDFGNVIMALVVLSEIHPYQAVRSVLLRSAYLLIPLSVVTIKYFPDVGRYYDRWAHTAYFSGVAGDKNLLGMALFVCGLFLFNEFLDSRKGPDAERLRAGIPLMVLIMMAFWLLMKAYSVTAIVCTILGAVILYVLKRGGRQRLVISISIAAVLGLFTFSVLDFGALLGGLLGRDVTLTGRTEIWRILLDEKINPLLGTGFYSFWLGSRIDKLSEQYHFTLNEAHNGYLETYLNSGIVGLALLVLVLAFSLRARWRELGIGTPAAPFYVSFLIATVLYNISEATFNRLSIIWFTFMIVILAHHEHPAVQEEKTVRTAAIPARSLLRT